MGYTLIANTTANVSTNATFRTWGSAISAVFANSGWVQTGDPGQVNWATATAPAATNTAAGFEIWRMNDALQSVAPVYLYIGYGAGTNITFPALLLQIGSGSANTSLPSVGPITGLAAFQTGPVLIDTGAAYTNNTLLSYFCGGTDRMVMALHVRGTGAALNYGLLWAIERIPDSNGNPTTDGVLFTYHRISTSVDGQVVWNPVVGPQGVETSSTFAILNPASGGSTLGSNTSVYPLFHSRGGGPFLNPGLNVLGYFNAEYTANSANTFSFYGNNHTYMPLGNSAIYNQSTRSNNSIGYMIRWE